MSSYDQLPIELKENILKYLSPEEYSNMMFTSKSNLYVGKGGMSSYMRNNLPYKTVTLKADNWLDICDDPLVLRFELDNIINNNYNINVIMQISGRFFKQDNRYFLCGIFDVIIKYVIHEENDEDNEYEEYYESHELHLKCNFKNNKLEGLYYVYDTADGNSIIEYRKYNFGIKVSGVFFLYGELTINIRDQFGRNYKQYIFYYPEKYINKNMLLKRYPDLNVLHSDSYENVENFIKNVTRGKYNEFKFFCSKQIHNNVYTHINHNYNVVNEIPNIHKMDIESFDRLFKEW